MDSHRLIRWLVTVSLVPTAVFAVPVAVPFDSDRWQFSGRENRLEEHLGRPALFLQNARAILADVDFREGVVEFDIAFAGDRGFSGVMFHHKGEGDFEQFYMRPHQSGFPDASQYQPVFAGWDAWQIFYGPGFGAEITYQTNVWQHVKLVVAGGQADVYVDSDEPVLFVEDLLRHDPGGGLGVVSAFAPAHFANFQFEEMAGLTLKGRAVQRDPLPDGLVRSWRVSAAFDEELLSGATELSQVESGNLTWTDVPVEVIGVANMARALSGGGDNTALAEVTLHSERDQVALLDFGFSDRVHAFVNGQLVYVGSDGYRTRDHRFLGTVGLFDTLALQLVAGQNVVTFAVSEDFGGFAIAGRLRPADGVRVVE